MCGVIVFCECASDFASILFSEVGIVGHVYGLEFIYVVMGLRNLV